MIGAFVVAVFLTKQTNPITEVMDSVSWPCKDDVYCKCKLNILHRI